MKMFVCRWRYSLVWPRCQAEIRVPERCILKYNQPIRHQLLVISANQIRTSIINQSFCTWVTENIGSTRLLVSLHSTKTLTRDQSDHITETQHQQMNPDVGRPAMSLNTENNIILWIVFLSNLGSMHFYCTHIISIRHSGVIVTTTFHFLV